MDSIYARKSNDFISLLKLFPRGVIIVIKRETTRMEYCRQIGKCNNCKFDGVKKPAQEVSNEDIL